MHELTLDQMLADPIVRLLMARDGVAEADLRALAARIRPDRGGALPAPARGIGPERRSFEPESRA
jgi:hypothetical protein